MPGVRTVALLRSASSCRQECSSGPASSGVGRQRIPDSVRRLQNSTKLVCISMNRAGEAWASASASPLTVYRGLRAGTPPPGHRGRVAQALEQGGLAGDPSRTPDHMAGTPAPAPDDACLEGGSLTALLEAPSLAGAASEGLPGASGAPAEAAPGYEAVQEPSGRPPEETSPTGPADGAAGGGVGDAAGAGRAAAAQQATAGAESAEQSAEMLEAAASLGILGSALPRSDGPAAVPLSAALAADDAPQPDASLHSFAAAASALFSQLQREGCVNLAPAAQLSGAPAPHPPASVAAATPLAPLPHIPENGPMQPEAPGQALQRTTPSLDLSPFASRLAPHSAPKASETGAAAATTAAWGALQAGTAPAGPSTSPAGRPLTSLPAPFPAAGSITNSPGACMPAQRPACTHSACHIWAPPTETRISL